jgi:hypothetical protein
MGGKMRQNVTNPPPRRNFGLKIEIPRDLDDWVVPMRKGFRYLSSSRPPTAPSIWSALTWAKEAVLVSRQPKQWYFGLLSFWNGRVRCCSEFDHLAVFFDIFLVGLNSSCGVINMSDDENEDENVFSFLFLRPFFFFSAFKSITKATKHLKIISPNQTAMPRLHGQMEIHLKEHTAKGKN